MLMAIVTAMIGLALIISIAAVIIALVKNSCYKNLVIILATMAVIALLVTVHFTNQTDLNNPFAAIGPAIIGSTVVLILSFTAFTLSFFNKR